ncbi:hypothetical protein BC831DRAFT_57592 [Entophlyctis helioformis]|nr:hypothetical protein BC831DRAFT_57592 [Entophlyctis helioformis]
MMSSRRTRERSAVKCPRTCTRLQTRPMSIWSTTARTSPFLSPANLVQARRKTPKRLSNTLPLQPAPEDQRTSARLSSRFCRPIQFSSRLEMPRRSATTTRRGLASLSASNSTPLAGSRVQTSTSTCWKSRVSRTKPQRSETTTSFTSFSRARLLTSKKPSSLKARLRTTDLPRTRTRTLTASTMPLISASCRCDLIMQAARQSPCRAFASIADLTQCYDWFRATFNAVLHYRNPSTSWASQRTTSSTCSAQSPQFSIWATSPSSQTAKTMPAFLQPHPPSQKRCATSLASPWPSSLAACSSHALRLAATGSRRLETSSKCTIRSRHWRDLSTSACSASWLTASTKPCTRRPKRQRLLACLTLPALKSSMSIALSSSASTTPTSDSSSSSTTTCSSWSRKSTSARALTGSLSTLALTCSRRLISSRRRRPLVSCRSSTKSV